MATKPVAAKLSRAERLAKLAEKIAHTDVGSSGSAGFWSPAEGRNVIRILPEVKNMEFFFQTVGRHNFPPKGEKHAYCPKFTSEGQLPCPVCEMVDDLYKSGSKANKELAGSLRTRKMYWMNVIVRGKDGNDTGPFIYTPGVKTFTQISSLIQDPDYGDITDVNDGLDLVILRTGTGLDTEYDVKPRRQSTPLTSDQETLDKWIEDAKDLSVIEVSEDPEEDKELSSGHAVYLLPYNRLVRELELDSEPEDAEPDAAEDDEDDVEPAPKSKVAKPVVKAHVDEDEDDADYDNAPAPAKRTAKEEVQTRMARRSIRR